MPTEAELWFGVGAEHRRTASLVTHLPSSGKHYVVYEYTVRAGDEDTDGILLGANPLGQNANFDLTLEDQNQVPADLTLPAVQLDTGQTVDGSQEKTCVDIECFELSVGSSAMPLDIIVDVGFDLQTIASLTPLTFVGGLSGVTVKYSETESVIVGIGYVEPEEGFVFCGYYSCPNIRDPFIWFTICRRPAEMST